MTTRKSTKKPKVVAESTQRDKSAAPDAHAEPANKIHEAGTKNPITSNAPETDNVTDDPTQRIAPNKTPRSGTEAHEIATSRGLEVGFHQMPAGGLMNIDNLKG